MADYDRSTITFKDGKFYSNGKELTANDQVKWTVGEEPDGGGFPQSFSRPLWSFGSVQEVLNTPQHIKGTEPIFGGDDVYYSDVANPDYATHSATANPFKTDGKTGLLSDTYRNALYGGAISFTQGAQKFDGTEQTYYGRDQTRTQVADKLIVPLVQNSLKQMFPNATQAELDEAAYKALTVNDPNAPKIHGMAPAQWNRDKTEEVLRKGYGDGRIRPTDIIRRIGYFMGGVPPAAEQHLTQWENDNKETLGKVHESIYKYDKSQGMTFKNVVNDIVTMMPKFADMALSVFPPTATAWNTVKAVNAGMQGDIKGMITNGFGAYMAGTTSTPGASLTKGMEAGLTKTIAEGAINGALTGAVSGAVNGGSFGSVIKGAAVGAAAGGAGAGVKGYFGPGYTGSIAGGAVSGAINAAGNGGNALKGGLIGAASGAVQEYGRQDNWKPENIKLAGQIVGVVGNQVLNNKGNGQATVVGSGSDSTVVTGNKPPVTTTPPPPVQLPTFGSMIINYAPLQRQTNWLARDFRGG